MFISKLRAGGKNDSSAHGKAIAVPDFRNVGVMLRVVLIAEGLRFAESYLAAGDMTGALSRIVASSRLFEPVLLMAVLSLFLLAPRLSRVAYRLGVLGVLLVTVASAQGWLFLLNSLQRVDALPGSGFVTVSAALTTLAILGYFNWRYRVLSPAWSEARLMALQARIRPHFLFNSLNTVLGLMRVEPRRAETVLEGLAELFRALMSDASVLVSLDRELALARAYAEVEAVRLEGRLTVVWQCQSAPMDARVPPLILQPLLENAVYHGIEPVAEGGAVTVTVFAKDGQLNMVVRNPYHAGQAVHSGNRMALENIRERLELHFDEEAHMKIYQSGDEFIVQIRIPYKHG